MYYIPTDAQTVARSCMPGLMPTDEDQCDSRKEAKGDIQGTIWTCYCATDNCNDGVKHTMTSYVLVTSVLTVLSLHWLCLQ